MINIPMVSNSFRRISCAVHKKRQADRFIKVSLINSHMACGFDNLHTAAGRFNLGVCARRDAVGPDFEELRLRSPRPRITTGLRRSFISRASCKVSGVTSAPFWKPASASRLTSWYSVRPSCVKPRPPACRADGGRTGGAPPVKYNRVPPPARDFWPFVPRPASLALPGCGPAAYAFPLLLRTFIRFQIVQLHS